MDIYATEAILYLNLNQRSKIIYVECVSILVNAGGFMIFGSKISGIIFAT